MGTVAIVDYGVGNLKSVANALSYLGCSSCITADPAELERADAIILPGVGAFPDAADRLRSGGLDQHVLAQGQKKPVLGICLGMQLLLEQGREVRPCPGLGVIRGTVDGTACGFFTTRPCSGGWTRGSMSTSSTPSAPKTPILPR